MTADDWDADDEDWYDDEDDDQLDEEEVAPCPECGAPIDVDAERCAECGYWVLELDRQEMRAARSTAGRLKFAAVVLLVVLLGFALLGGFMML